MSEIEDRTVLIESLGKPVDLALIPLPETPSRLTIVQHARRYPRQAPFVEGIVHMDPNLDARGTDPVRVTVQCAACLRTATGKGWWWVISVRGWNHGPDHNGMPHAPTPYKRCPECRAEGRHPATEPAA